MVAWPDFAFATGKERDESAFRQTLQVENHVIAFVPQIAQKNPRLPRPLAPRKTDDAAHVAETTDEIDVIGVRHPVHLGVQPALERMHRRQDVEQITERTQFDDENLHLFQGLETNNTDFPRLGKFRVSFSKPWKTGVIF